MIYEYKVNYYDADEYKMHQNAGVTFAKSFSEAAANLVLFYGEIEDALVSQVGEDDCTVYEFTKEKDNVMSNLFVIDAKEGAYKPFKDERQRNCL